MSRVPKVVVLAVCARPRPEYGFDGKVGLWSFTLERQAKRNNVRTGTVVGETMILEDVSVNAVVYRQNIIGEDGVFQLMRQKMRWFHKAARNTTVRGTRVLRGALSGDKWTFHAKQGRKCPEAGQPLLSQHDGAQPHTAELNRLVLAQHSKKCNFVIDVVVQPSQSPDLNVDDLAFFHSLQIDVSLVAKENRRDLLAAVQKCWEEYPLEKMESVWSCLYGSSSGILETGGDNDYKRHRGSRSVDSLSSEHSDLHDQLVPRLLVTGAKKKLVEMRAEQERGDDISETAEPDDDSSENDSDSE